MMHFSPLFLGFLFWYAGVVGAQSSLSKDTLYVLSGRVTAQSGRPVPNVSISLRPGLHRDSVVAVTDSNGYFRFLYPPVRDLALRARTSDTTITGLDTWDLVCISRYIVGIQALNTYQIIGADPNHSGTVSPVDVAGLRQLLLGKVPRLEVFGGMRFIDADQVFSDPQNPFADPIRDAITLSNLNSSHTDLDFIAVKVGDMDCSAVANNRSGVLSSRSVSWQISAAKNSAILSVPVRYTGQSPLSAMQFGLQYNPEQLSLIAPSAGDIPGLDLGNFGLLATGDIRFSWHSFDLEQTQIMPGQVLFYLNFEIKQPLTEQTPVLWISEAAMPALCWENDGATHRIAEAPATGLREADHRSGAPVVAEVFPNPAKSVPYLRVQTAQAGKVRLEISDGFGRRLGLRNVSVGEGAHTIELSELNGQASGVYQWWIKLPDGQIASGRVICQ